MATHRAIHHNRRWVVAVAHEITDNRIANNPERGIGRVLLEERITSYLGIQHNDRPPIGATDLEIAADNHFETDLPLSPQ